MNSIAIIEVAQSLRTDVSVGTFTDVSRSVGLNPFRQPLVKSASGRRAVGGGVGAKKRVFGKARFPTRELGCYREDACGASCLVGGCTAAC